MFFSGISRMSRTSTVLYVVYTLSWNLKDVDYSSCSLYSSCFFRLSCLLIYLLGSFRIVGKNVTGKFLKINLGLSERWNRDRRTTGQKCSLFIYSMFRLVKMGFVTICNLCKLLVIFTVSGILKDTL